MTDKKQSNAERQAAFRARKAKAGETEVRGIYAHPDDHPPIKQYAQDLRKKRGKRIGDQAVRDAIDAAPEPQAVDSPADPAAPAAVGRDGGRKC